MVAGTAQTGRAAPTIEPNATKRSGQRPFCGGKSRSLGDTRPDVPSLEVSLVVRGLSVSTLGAVGESS